LTRKKRAVADDYVEQERVNNILKTQVWKAAINFVSILNTKRISLFWLLLSMFQC
jgi:hypothetical protein